MAFTPNGLAVAAFRNGVVFLDEKLNETARIPNLSNAWDVAPLADHLAIADGPDGLAFATVAKGKKPKIVGRLSLPGFAKRLTVAENGTLLVALGGEGIAQVDARNPKKPKLVAHLNTPGSALDIAVQGDVFSVADWTSIRLYQLKPDSPPQAAGRSPDERGDGACLERHDGRRAGICGRLDRGSSLSLRRQ